MDVRWNVPRNVTSGMTLSIHVTPGMTWDVIFRMTLENRVTFRMTMTFSIVLTSLTQFLLRSIIVKEESSEFDNEVLPYE